jgi:hypothetical protein
MVGFGVQSRRNDDTLQQLSKADGAAFCLTLRTDWESSYGASPVTDEFSTEFHLQNCWETLKQVRTALQVQASEVQASEVQASEVQASEVQASAMSS